MNDKTLAHALGLENAYGFHIEGEPRLPCTTPARERPSTRWYPCIKRDHTYMGCLGAACPLEVCWTGMASTSYTLGLRHQFYAAASDYAKRAQCLQCRHIEEICVEAIDSRRGVIHLPLLRCVHLCWQNPISASAFVRRRIPPNGDHNLAHCPLFEQASTPIAIMEQYRLHLNDRVRARRATRVARGEQHG
jgi:hypothetical protein